MKVFLIAVVAVAISGAAFAKDLKGTVMTDSEMDKVTAGDAASPDISLGRSTALSVANENALLNNHVPPSDKGFGINTCRGALAAC